MSWFKKIFDSQSSSPGSSQGSSQELKVHYAKQKTETDGNNAEIGECDNTTQSTQDSCYSWSGVSQEIDIKGEKRELSDDKEEPCWESSKSQSTQKSTQSTQLQEFKTSQQGEAKAEATSSQTDNKSDDENEGKEAEKISFYLKLGIYKEFKYM